MSNTVETKQKNLLYVHSIIMIVLTIGVGMLPAPVESITPLGMDVLGIFIGSLYGWCFIGFIWPSLFAMLMLGMTEYSTITSVISTGFSDSSILTILFMFIFVTILDHSGLVKYFTNWFISRKICAGRPWVFTWVFFIGAILVSGVINMYGGILVLWAAIYNLFRDLGYKKGDGYVGYMCAGIVYISTLSVFVMPFLPMAQMILGFLKASLPDVAIPTTSWMICGPIFLLILVTAYVLIGKYVLRLDVEKLKDAGDKYTSLRGEKLDREQKFGAMLLALFVVIVLVPTLLPADSMLKAFLNNYGALGGSILCICLSSIFLHGNQKYDFKYLVYKGVSWDLIILLAATMPLCAAMESDATGIVATILAFVGPIVTNLSPVAFLFVSLLIFGLITQVVHNMVLIIAFMPTLATLAMGFGIDPVLFGMMFAIMMQAAFMTPSASAQAVFVFGNTEWITTRHAYMYGTLFFVLVLILLMTVLYPLGRVLF